MKWSKISYFGSELVRTDSNFFTNCALLDLFLWTKCTSALYSTIDIGRWWCNCLIFSESIQMYGSLKNQAEESKAQSTRSWRKRKVICLYHRVFPCFSNWMLFLRNFSSIFLIDLFHHCPTRSTLNGSNIKLKFLLKIRTTCHAVIFFMSEFSREALFTS